MATLEVPCRYCSQTKSVRKHGTGAKEQIVDMAMNNAGLRDTA